MSSSANKNTTHRNSGGAGFAATRWSQVMIAGDSANPKFHEALSLLCRSYWRPLYSYVRRRGYSAADAHDLTQEFFARLLEKNYLGSANPERGKFRSYLLGAMRHFLSDNRDRAMAQKRGGGIFIIPIESETAEGRRNFDPVDDMTAEKLYDRQWALEILDKTMSALMREFKNAGKIKQFMLLKDALIPDRNNCSYKDVATKLGTSEGNVKVAIHRLRRRYKEVLRSEIAQTLANPADIDDELRHLFSALG